MAVLPLESDITAKGLDQKTLHSLLTNYNTVVNELVDDHATNKTTIDESRTAILELIDDHDTNQTHLGNIKTLLNQIRQSMLYQCLGNPTFAIDTNFDVKSTEPVSYLNGGTLKTLADDANFNTGTTKTITGAKWGAAMLTVNSSGTGVVTYASAAAYDTEALAIAALAAPAVTDTVMGYVTILAHASGFTAGTDALEGGTGGNVATTTNYYNNINGNTLMIGAAVSTSAESALAAGDPTASAATLTNSTDLVLTKG